MPVAMWLSSAGMGSPSFRGSGARLAFRTQPLDVRLRAQSLQPATQKIVNALLGKDLLDLLGHLSQGRLRSALLAQLRQEFFLVVSFDFGPVGMRQGAKAQVNKPQDPELRSNLRFYMTLRHAITLEHGLPFLLIRAFRNLRAHLVQTHSQFLRTGIEHLCVYDLLLEECL